METFTFNYKTKVEQFKEQFPELYQEIYDLGYKNGQASYEDCDYDDGPEFAVPKDESKRFYISDCWSEIYAKAVELENQGYKAGNTDWKGFMNTYKNWDYRMYIAWNPTHKQFAVESNIGTIDELYPHLVYAEDFKDDEKLPF